MEQLQRYRAMAAFCRQRAKMDGEDARFWLAEAAVWQKLLGNVPRAGPMPPLYSADACWRGALPGLESAAGRPTTGSDRRAPSRTIV